MKITTSKMRFLSLLLALTMLVGIGAPQTVFAKSSNKVKNPAMVDLSLNKSYAKYDITGDGKADTVKCTGKWEESYDGFQGLKITINGKTVLRDKETFYYELNAKLCTLKNGKVYLYLYNPAENGDARYCGIYQYQKGKLKCVLNMNKFFGSGKLGYHTQGGVTAVSGNKLTVNMYQQNYELGGINVAFDYKYSKGKLVKDGNVAKEYTIWAADNNSGKLTAQKNMRVYTKPDGKTKAFSLKKGQQIKVTGIYCKSGKMFLKVQRISDGKKGYIKCIEDYPKDFIAPFAEVVYAG